jgi:hypothetical protein
MLAELSYRLVETPFRTGAVQWGRGVGARRRLAAASRAGVAATGALWLLFLVVAVAGARPPEPPAFLTAKAIHHDAAPLQTASAETTAAPAPSPCVIGPQPREPAATAGPGVVAPGPPPCRITAIGDSVMLGAAEQLERMLGDLNMDAELGLQTGNALDILRSRRDAGELGDIVVVHIGNNGIIMPQQLEEILSLLHEVRVVVFVNDRVPRPWEAPNNATLDDVLRRHPNARLVDWHGFSAGLPGMLWDDGIHLRPDGAQRYAELIFTTMQDH